MKGIQTGLVQRVLNFVLLCLCLRISDLTVSGHSEQPRGPGERALLGMFFQSSGPCLPSRKWEVIKLH